MDKIIIFGKHIYFSLLDRLCEYMIVLQPTMDYTYFHPDRIDCCKREYDNNNNISSHDCYAYL